MFRVGRSAAWYSGSPIPLGPGESATPRYVLRVQVPDGDREAVVKPVPVPVSRRVVAVNGSPDDVIARVRNLVWNTPLPPYVVAEVQVDHHRVGLDGEILAAAERPDDGGPIVAWIHQNRGPVAGEAGPGAPLRPLRDLTPEDVFRELCRAQGIATDDALLAAFRSLLDPGTGEGEASA
jgi:hypothetical protein